MARKILLADDSVTAQNMGRKILADAGYEVIAVNNGSAALKKIAELKPDLVILDVYMPGYSGLEVCQRLKESQETARIPVLLTVGKLEPFKPEEAQRVRAEGFIVKPFEASELLSALSKLEDKVVPRAEPSKPGRFARAMMAADDSDRRNEPSSSETGWKSRIAFPAKKKEADETYPEEVASGKKSEKNKKERKQDSPVPETSVDIAALSPEGFPQDVTPAEVAAITSAVAQIQIAEAASRDQYPQTENDNFQTASSQTTGEFSVGPEPERFQDQANEIQANSTAEVTLQAETETASQEPTQVAISSELATVVANHSRNGDEKVAGEKLPGEKLEEPHEAPVTMAVASEAGAGSRWTAVPVALGSDEASISLDHEMQKAYAAFAAADYATSAGTVEAESASQSLGASTTAEVGELPQAQIAASSSQEPAAVSESDPAAIGEANSSVGAVQTPDTQQPEQKLERATEPVSAVEAHAADAAPEPLVVTPETDSAVPQPAIASNYTSTAMAETSEPKPDSEDVKTSAAAWASWRQIRDTSKNTEESQTQESVAAEPPSSNTAALAAAAGAEQTLQEASAAAPADNPSDVASIVDSVLAGLRPKLMEEISRKMAEKK